MNQKYNPFQLVWRYLSIPLGVLGLLGLSDNLVSWVDNIQNIIESYYSIVHPTFNYLLGWLPFKIPNALYDYFFIGFLFRSAAVKTSKDFDDMNIEIGISEKTDDNDILIVRVIADTIFHILYLVFTAIIWPVMVAIYVSRAFNKNLKEQASYVYKLTINWFLAIFLIFLLILIINYTYCLKVAA